MDTDQLFKDLHQVHEFLESGRILLGRQMLEKILGISKDPAPTPEPEAA